MEEAGKFGDVGQMRGQRLPLASVVSGVRVKIHLSGPINFQVSCEE